MNSNACQDHLGDVNGCGSPDGDGSELQVHVPFEESRENMNIYMKRPNLKTEITKSNIF